MYGFETVVRETSQRTTSPWVIDPLPSLSATSLIEIEPPDGAFLPPPPPAGFPAAAVPAKPSRGCATGAIAVRSAARMKATSRPSMMAAATWRVARLAVDRIFNGGLPADVGLVLCGVERLRRAGWMW